MPSRSVIFCLTSPITVELCRRRHTHDQPTQRESRARSPNLDVQFENFAGQRAHVQHKRHCGAVRRSLILGARVATAAAAAAANDLSTCVSFFFFDREDFLLFNHASPSISARR